MKDIVNQIQRISKLAEVAAAEGKDELSSSLYKEAFSTGERGIKMIVKKFEGDIYLFYLFLCASSKDFGEDKERKINVFTESLEEITKNLLA